jgi:hypothetical protein
VERRLFFFWPVARFLPGSALSPRRSYFPPGEVALGRPGNTFAPAYRVLHGFGDTGDMWEPLAAVLAKDHTVIVRCTRTG